MTNKSLTLADYGWSSHFQSQIQPDEFNEMSPVRVMAVHRNGLDVAGPDFKGRTHLPRSTGDEDQATIGDWLLIAARDQTPKRVLERKSLIKRRAAGKMRRVQLIAANVDTLFIVSSCNQDFNTARLERYLVLARESEVMPIIVLTKADLVENPSDYVASAARLLPGLLVECLDAREADDVSRLGAWSGQGQTIALVGSSGVGKSTLVNSLTGGSAQATAPIREEDAHGRHTTSGRSIHRLTAGGWLIDTPGMREIQLADVEAGVGEIFEDIVALSQECRFSDCGHESEKGCAILAAIGEGRLDAERLARFRKLAREERRNSEDLRQRRARERGFGRMIRDVQKEKRGRWKK